MPFFAVRKQKPLKALRLQAVLVRLQELESWTL